MSNNLTEYIKKNRIAEALEIRGMKQVDLCHLTGVSSSVLTSWIKQRWQPRPAILRKLAKALNVSEMWLAGYDWPMELTASQCQNNDIVYRLALNLIRLNDDQLSIIENIISQFNLKEV